MIGIHPLLSRVSLKPSQKNEVVIQIVAERLQGHIANSMLTYDDSMSYPLYDRDLGLGRLQTTMITSSASQLRISCLACPAVRMNSHVRA